MDVANEILDAIEIIVDKKIREQATQIYSGICKNVNGDSCVMFINGKNNTVQFYGSTPIVGAIYKVFVPYGNMSSAFAITGIVAKSDDEDDKKDLYYSNPNLLDNWYFGNPVNQRGQTERTGSQSGYFIDRWKFGSYDQTVTVTESGLHWSTAEGIWCTQVLENFDELIGRTLTLSAIIDGVLYSVTGVLTESGKLSMKPVGNLFVELTHDEKGFRFVTYNNPTPTVTILAAKLELGSQQTLAHQDENGVWQLNEIPDYGEQLARCQRYFQTFATESLRPTNALDFRPVMRATPALSAITVGGKTLYTASADL